MADTPAILKNYSYNIPQLGWEPLGNPWEQAATQIVRFKHFFYSAEKHAPTIFLTLLPLETRLCKDGGIIKVHQ